MELFGSVDKVVGVLASFGEVKTESVVNRKIVKEGINGELRDGEAHNTLQDRYLAC